MALSAGVRLGAYEILGPLNRGGQGDVWRARDTRLNRDVAVKVLRDDLASDSVARERFDREAKAVAALSHPNILDVHDVGSTDGTSWLVTELLEGETLKEKLESGPIPWRRAVEIALEIADGLAVAHGRGVIHRDIKPSNVFLTREGRVKVLDFGIAALTEEASVPAEQRDLTAPQAIVGTAGYLAPEQIRRERADERSDLFALGCVLYEMLTGRRTFPGDTPPESLVATLRGEPKDPADLVPDLPPDLRRLVLRCLEKRPDRRFQTAADLADALRRPFEPASRPFPAFVTSSETEVLPAARRLRPSLRRALGAVAAAVLVAVVAWLFVPRRHAAGAERLAVLPFENETGDAAKEYLCEGVTSSLIDSVSPVLSVIARATVYEHVKKGGDRGPRAAARDLGATKVLTGRVKRKGADVVVEAELVDGATGERLWKDEVTDRAGDSIPAAAELAPKIARALRPSLTNDEARRLVPRPHRPDAWDRVQRGRFFLNQRTGEGFKKAQEYFQQALSIDPDEAEAYRGLAEVLHLLAYYAADSPATLIPKQREFASKALALDPFLSGPHAILADARYMFDHDWPAAEEEFRKALALNPNDAEAHQWYSNFLTASSRFDEASAQILRARELDPLNAIIQMDAGLANYWASDLAGAEKDIRSAIELAPNEALPHIFIALPLLRSNRAQDALKDLDKAREREPDDPFVVAFRGYAFSQLGRDEEAKAARRELDALAKERYVGGFPFAILALGQKRYKESLDWLQRAADDGEGRLAYLGVEPAFDPLRADPRFQALVKRLGIPVMRR